MVINQLNIVSIDELIIGKKYYITRSDDTKFYVGIYEKIDRTDDNDIDIPISDDENSESEKFDTEKESDVEKVFDDLYAWFKNVTFETNKMGDLGFPISKVLVYEY